MKYKEYEIDLTRLVRDYSNNPLIVTPNGIGSEQLAYSELNYLCNEIYMKSEDICLFLGIKQHKLSRMLKDLNIKKIKPTGKIKRPKSKETLQKFKEQRLKRFPLDVIKKQYFEEKMSIQQLADFYHCGKNIMNKFLLENNIKKTLDQVASDRKNTNKSKYGCEVPTQNKIIREKTTNTLKQKYGVTNISQIKGSREKAANTMLEKYGKASFTQTEEYKIKSKGTCLKKYGVDHHMHSKDFLKHYDQIFLQKYNKKRYVQTEEYKVKSKETCLKKYNYPTFLQSDEYKTKTKHTVKEKYGVDFITQASEFIQKRINTIKEKYNRINPGQINISDETLAILQNKEQLTKVYNEIGSFVGVGKRLNVGDTTVARYISFHNIPVITERNRSEYEDELINLIVSFYKGKILTNDRSILNGQELDVVIPELKLAFEFNGMYWHSTLFKPTSYHLNKSKLCEEKGYHLIHIYEPEWIQDKEKLVKYIKNLLLPKIRLGARQVVFKNITNSEANIFYKTNHLQGKSQNLLSFGLFYNNELVSAMSFSKPGENKKNECDFIMNRYCVKNGYTIAGGFQKLLKHSNIHGKIRTYQLIDKFDGSIYKNNNFKKINENKMYFWCKNNVWLPRSKTNRKALRITNDISESEYMTNNGYVKLYTAGTVTWEIDL